MSELSFCVFLFQTIVFLNVNAFVPDRNAFYGYHATMS